MEVAISCMPLLFTAKNSASSREHSGVLLVINLHFTGWIRAWLLIIRSSTGQKNRPKQTSSNTRWQVIKVTMLLLEYIIQQLILLSGYKQGCLLNNTSPILHGVP